MDAPPHRDTPAIPEEATLAPLLSRLHDPRKEVRADAARRLGIAGASAVPGLVQALQDPDWVVRYRVLEALIPIHDARVDPVLITSLNDNRDHVRYMAAKGLGLRRTRSAVWPLIQSLDDDNEFVRMCVIRALVAIGDPGALGAFRERRRREAVTRVLEELERAIPRLEHTS